MRNPQLHTALEAFTTDSGLRLKVAADGDEIPFELVRGDGRVPLYCYRPLTGAFIRSHLGLLVALPTYAPAAQALEGVPGVEAYLRARGEQRVSDSRRDRADAALRCFLARVYEERSEFEFDADRFGQAYDELERWLYDGRCLTEVVGELRGLELDPDTPELSIGDGLSLMRADAVVSPPPEIEPPKDSGDGPCGAGVLVVLRATQDRSESAPVALARTRFRQTLTALRLFESSSFALAPFGYARVDGGAWAAVPLDGGGHAGAPILIEPAQEDELRAFCNLIARRTAGSAPDNSGAGEVAWALARFDLGFDRHSPLQRLTDHLLALRALLEPEGPSSGRLAQRLAVICARPGERAALAERTAHAISLERAVVAGLAPAGPDARGLISELSDHLRAILRDVLCGYLDADVRSVADGLLREAVEVDAAALR